MKCMLFEDNVASAISKKITDRYNNTITVMRSGSNVRLKSKLKDYVGSKDEILIYLDMPVDNSNVFNILVELQKFINANELYAVIIPIPSIEYAICKSFNIDMNDWVYKHEDTYLTVKGYYNKQKCTFETYTKYLLETRCNLDSINLDSVIYNLSIFYNPEEYTLPVENASYEYCSLLYSRLGEIVKLYFDCDIINETAYRDKIDKISKFLELFNNRWR